MPYRNAYAFVLALLALTFVAFWPTYLSDLPNANPAHHWHAGSSVLWTLLAALQSWTIHHDRWALHRTAGLAVFLLFPFFLVAGLWVIHVEATTLAAGLTDPGNLNIAQFGFFDPLANLGFAILFWGGLRYRYKVQLHARYMLGTVMFVVVRGCSLRPLLPRRRSCSLPLAGCPVGHRSSRRFPRSTCPCC